jgi:hypothetical protein
MAEQAITQEQLFLPLLWFIADRGGSIDRQADNLLEALADEIGLSTEERERETAGGRDQWRSTVENSRRKLVGRGLIATGEWGIWRLTDEGLRQAGNPPAEMVEQFEEWLDTRGEESDEHRERVKTSSPSPTQEVADEVEEDETSSQDIPPEVEVRESILIQAQLALIGTQMGFSVWLPLPDRARVLEHIECPTLIDTLPLGFDVSVLRMVALIDVLWLDRFAVMRAFEVEHTTAVYSGLLRMGDLLTLQPNLNIKLHIVAPAERRKKVFREIQRPVFAQLRGGPLSDRCTFVSYEAVRDLAQDEHLAHMSHSVVDEYAEVAETTSGG